MGNAIEMTVGDFAVSVPVFQRFRQRNGHADFREVCTEAHMVTELPDEPEDKCFVADNLSIAASVGRVRSQIGMLAQKLGNFTPF